MFLHCRIIVEGAEKLCASFTLEPHLFSHHLSAVDLPMSDLFIEIETIMSSKLANVVYGAIVNCSARSKMLLRL